MACKNNCEMNESWALATEADHSDFKNKDSLNLEYTNIRTLNNNKKWMPIKRLFCCS